MEAARLCVPYGRAPRYAPWTVALNLGMKTNSMAARRFG